MMKVLLKQIERNTKHIPGKESRNSYKNGNGSMARFTRMIALSGGTINIHGFTERVTDMLHGDTYTKLSESERHLLRDTESEMLKKGHTPGESFGYGIRAVESVNPELGRGLWDDAKMFNYLTDGYSKRTALFAMMYDKMNELDAIMGNEPSYDNEDYYELWCSGQDDEE